MLHLDAAWVNGVRRENSHPSRSLTDSGAHISQEPAAYGRFCELNRLLFSTSSVHEKEAGLIEFMGDLDDRPGPTAPGPVPMSAAAHRDRLQPVVDRLRSEVSAIPSLAELATLVKMGRYQLIRAFRTVTGLTPHAWLLNHRVNRAREELWAGRGLADIAYQLGFADQSHFQRTFKAHTGVTPGLYRAQLSAISFNTPSR